MEEEPDASESDAAESAPSLEPSPARTVPVRTAALCRSPRDVPRLRPISVPSGRVASILILVAARRRDDGTGCGADGLERVRRIGPAALRQRHGRGRPVRLSRPGSPRGVTGFEVELMTRLAGDLGVEPVFSQGQWDKLLQVLDTGRIDAGDQRLRVDRAARARLPGDAALLRLPAAVDGASRQPGPALGRPEAAAARRRPVDGRRAGRLGRRHLRGRAGGPERPRSSGSTARPTP